MHQIELLKKYGLSVRGARGQHLLIDENIQRKFADKIAPKPGETIVEIGPGLGAMTEMLLKSGAKVIAIEQDPRFIEILKGELGNDYQNLKLVQGDILKTDLRKFVKRRKTVRVVGNIPYYITAPILLYLIAHRAVIDSVFLTVQKEVADRIFAQPGTKAYGRLSILIRFYSDVEKLFDIARNCFSPRPEVDSTALQLIFHKKRIEAIDSDLFFSLVKAGFGERRKNILNAISHGLSGAITKEDLNQCLRAAAISPTTRAENLMIKDFIRLTVEVGRRRSVGKAH